MPNKHKANEIYARKRERDVKTENLFMQRPFFYYRKRQNREKELCSHKKSLKKKK